MNLSEPIALQWHNCYDGGWQCDIVAGAFAHPAKISRALIRRIYDHAFAEGWLHAGSLVVDPFGGIGGTALDAGLRGVQWIGCELEPRFSELGNDNISLWQSRFADIPNWTTPVLVRGDSRKLSEHVARACLVVSSPPYADSLSHVKDNDGIDQKIACAKQEGRTAARATWGANKGSAGWSGDEYGKSPGQLGRMKEGAPPALIVSSPPYASGVVHDGNGIDRSKLTGNAPGKNSQVGVEGYGKSAGQLGTMKEGQSPALIVSSPPYAEISTGAGGLNTRPPKHEGQQGGRTATAASQDTDQRYGASDGQLARMVVGSSPFLDPNAGKRNNAEEIATGKIPKIGLVNANDYGETEGQLARMVVGSPPFCGCNSDVPSNTGNRQAIGSAATKRQQYAESRVSTHNEHAYMSKEWLQHRKETAKTQNLGRLPETANDPEYPTFWSAAAEIVEQCRMILQPGGHAIWVVKDFVRAKKRVPFSDQWQALCEAHGFRLVCRHQAMLVAHHGEQDDIFGETKQLKTERKSFFRRLAEKKGSPAIDHEDIICMVLA